MAAGLRMKQRYCVKLTLSDLPISWMLSGICTNWQETVKS